MYTAEIVLKNETGLHARPAKMLVDECTKYVSDITIIKNEQEFNAKSILGIMSMGAMKGDKLIFQAVGKDEKEAIEGLVTLTENNFGE